jgi:hypothetical protein
MLEVKPTGLTDRFDMEGEKIAEFGIIAWSFNLG